MVELTELQVRINFLKKKMRITQQVTGYQNAHPEYWGDVDDHLGPVTGSAAYFNMADSDDDSWRSDLQDEGGQVGHDDGDARRGQDPGPSSGVTRTPPPT
eukprot:9636282-Heterocapsa_arctica.AAC.1